MAMTRLRIDLAYDGGGFYGWAKQPNLRTVQGTIEDALHKVLRVPAVDGSQAVLVLELGADGKVSAWRVGLPPQVDYVEGCG